jgi:hypothetical protein
VTNILGKISILNPPSKYVNHEGHEGHEGKRESKKTLFVCESPCKSVAKKIGGGFGPSNFLDKDKKLWSSIY